jgi:hypothetical protein
VRLLDLAGAFGIFDDGRTLPTHALLAVTPAGPPAGLPAQPPAAVASPPARGVAVLAPQTAYLITDILSDDVARQPAFGRNSVLNLPFPAAVKTGTTTDWRDNWAVGYSTQRIVGVWVGNADNSPMVDVSGVDGAGPIWHDLMLLAHPTPPPPFARPDRIVEEEICAPSGLLPTPACPRTRWERFAAGTAPTQPDTQFARLAVDLATGQLAAPTTPASRRADRVYWLLGPEYHDWMVGQGIPIAPIAAPGEALPGTLPETLPGAMPAAASALPAAASAPPPALRLASPASYTAYQLHPGLAAASQKLEVAGYTHAGEPWHHLRLVVDGQVLAEAAAGARLRAWWPMTLGPHAIWLEGERTPGGPTTRSAPAQINVEPFTADAVTMQIVD